METDIDTGEVKRSAADPAVRAGEPQHMRVGGNLDPAFSRRNIQGV